MLTILLLFKDWGSTYTQKANKDTHWPHKYIRKRFFCREKRRCRHTLLQPFRKREFANELKFKVTMFTTLHIA